MVRTEFTFRVFILASKENGNDGHFKDHALKAPFRLLAFTKPPLRRVDLRVPQCSGVTYAFLRSQACQATLPIAGPRSVRVEGDRVGRLMVVNLCTYVDVHPCRLKPAIQPNVQAEVRHRACFVRLQDPASIIGRASRVFSVNDHGRQVQSVSQCFETRLTSVRLVGVHCVRTRQLMVNVRVRWREVRRGAWRNGGRW